MVLKINGDNRIKNILEENIKKYINKNKYLFLTDNAYTINCHLKPRLVANAVAESCEICKKQNLLKKCNKNCFKEIFYHGIVFATKYINNK